MARALSTTKNTQNGNRLKTTREQAEVLLKAGAVDQRVICSRRRRAC
jgi:hypothetical protein